jgi:hypothetical protein
MGWAFYSIRLVSSSYIRSVITRLVHKGTRSGLYSSQALANLSGLPDTLVSHVSGLGHLGGVEHQVDVVVLVEDRQVR